MKLHMKLATVLGCLAIFGMPGLTLAQQNVVVPNAFANVPGDTNNGFPFNLGSFTSSTQRYQQVYASNQFSAISVPTFISAISFRVATDGSGSAFSSTLPSIQINLSTTSATPSSLSSTYSDNIGGNDAQVYSGALTLSSTNTGSPPNFDITITLQTPFLYDPVSGNLLMDVRNFGGGSTTQFDAINSDPSVERVWNNDVTSPTGSVDGLGLITQFTFTAVPEPTTWALIGVGSLGTGVYAWRKKQLSIKAGMAKLKK